MPELAWSRFVRMRRNERLGVHRLRMGLHCVIVLVVSISGQLAAAADFSETVGPILTRNCADCHSDKTKTSGFSVASQTSVIAGGSKHGKAVHPGDPAGSP